MGVFTLLWGSWTIQGFGVFAVVTVAASTALAAVFLVRGIALFIAAPTLVSAEAVQAAQDARTGYRFRLVVGAETLAILLVSLALGTTGHDRYVNPAIALVVGLHFLALVAVFPTRRTVNLVTGSVLSLAAIGAVVLLASRAAGTDVVWSAVALIAASCTSAQGLTLLAARRRLLDATTAAE